MHKNRPIKLCIITKISKLIILHLKNKLTYYILLTVNSAAAGGGYSSPVPCLARESMVNVTVQLNRRQVKNLSRVLFASGVIWRNHDVIIHGSNGK